MLFAVRPTTGMVSLLLRNRERNPPKTYKNFGFHLFYTCFAWEPQREKVPDAFARAYPEAVFSVVSPDDIDDFLL